MTTHKQYKIIILPEAQKDIREIVIYIARELAAPQAALNLEEALFVGIRALAKMPERIKTTNDSPWKEKGLRKIRIKNYYVYFIINEDEGTIKILAVIYVGRHQEKQLKKRDIENK